MANDFLLEIGTEEIPAKFSPGAMTQLEEQARKRFAELRLSYYRGKSLRDSSETGAVGNGS